MIEDKTFLGTLTEWRRVLLYLFALVTAGLVLVIFIMKPVMTYTAIGYRPPLTDWLSALVPPLVSLTAGFIIASIWLSLRKIPLP